MIARLAFILFSFFTCGIALLEEKFVTFEPVDGAVRLRNATLLHDAKDAEAVQISVRSLASDWEQITGSRLSTCEWSENKTKTCQSAAEAIIVGTVDSALITELVHRGKIDVSDLHGKWEKFTTTVVSDPLIGVDRALVIAGSDKRGTAFGVYTLAEQSGQSPLHFWSDVPATKHDEIYALPHKTTHGEPSVKYRGLFINDEAPALTGWWARRHNVSDYTFDSEFYTHVFDLIVRLKGNFIWPAMWGSFVPKPGRIFFTDYPKNQQLAHDYSIVVSTSHHEPMQRASNEWQKKNGSDGPWNFVTNREKVLNFMEEGVIRAGNNESYFTLGMRGENDGPINGDDPAAILEDIIAAQRGLIAKHHGSASDRRQVWTVYKEVQAYYEAGLKPPSDVTIMFADDNWGNIRRLPAAEDGDRSGGFGLYHHLSYVGRPKSYKWMNTNNLPKLYKDLHHAHERGANQIWVFNVGDIKSLELPFELAMTVAWNASAVDFDTIPEWLVTLSQRDFGPDLAGEASRVLFDYSHLVGLRKFEITLPNTYSIMNYHEAERVLQAWTDLAARAKSVHSRLPADRRDPFYYHAVYPSVAGANYHSIQIKTALNYQFATERRNSANQLATDILDEFGIDWDLVLEYDQAAGGKWAGIMSTPKFDIGSVSWIPPSKDVLPNISYVQTRQDFDYGFGNLGIYAQGSQSAARQGRICASIDPAFPTEKGFKPVLPVITPYGPDFVTVDLFHRGDSRKSIAWSADVPYVWLQFSLTSGTVYSEQLEQRINITVDWSRVPEGFQEEFDVRINWEPEPSFDNLRLTVFNNKVPEGFTGFPDAGGVISIEGSHFQRSSSANSNSSVSFQHIPHLGSRSNSGSIALRPYHEARGNPSASHHAWVEYEIFLFGNATGQLNSTLYINSALDTDPNLPIHYSLTLDDPSTNPTMTRLLLQPSAVGELPDDWTTSVAEGVWKRTAVLGEVQPGKHTLRFGANSPELYLEKIVLEFGRPAPASYLGPPETRWL